MSITFGDILKHNNPIYPILDIEDVKGGTRIIATFSNTDLYNAFNNIPDKLKQNYTNIIVTSTSQHYYLSGTNATITTSWTLTGSGLSASGTTNSIAKWTGSTSLGDSLITDNGDTITINGNLTVIGTSSTITSENLFVKDPIILLAGSQSTPLFDSGLFVNRGTGDTQAFIWDESSSEFSFFSTTSSSSTLGNVSIGTYSNVRTGPLSVGTGITSSSTLFVKGTTSSIMRVVGTGATWSNSQSIFEINDSGVVSIGSSKSISGTKLFIQSSTSSSTIGDNVMLDLYNPDTVGLGSQVSEIAFSADTSGGVNAYNTQHRYAVISGYANTWNNVVTGGGIKFSTRNGTSGSLVTALVVAPNGSVYNTSRGSNTLYGLDALLVSTGTNNTAIGSLSLTSNTTGISNTAVGYLSQVNGTNSNYNTSVGLSSLHNNITDSTTAVGYQSLYYNTIGTRNTAVGYQSLFSNTAIVSTINITYGGSGYTINTTFSNIQLSHISGSTALIYPIVTVYVGLTGSVNIVTLVTRGVGFRDNTTVMGANLGTGVTFSVNASFLQYGQYNTALGYKSLYSNTTGNGNTSLGEQSLYSNTTGYSNNSVGQQSLYSNTTGAENTALGQATLYFNTTGSNNTAIGYGTLFYNKDGIANTAIGYQSAYNNTTGYKNTTLGYQSAYNNNIGTNNIAIGYRSLFTATQSYWNTAIGDQSLYSNTGGIYNIAIGVSSLYSNTTGEYNIALGYNSLLSNTIGSYNTALGLNSLSSNTTGSYNTALGQNSLLNNKSAHSNTAIGVESQRTATQSLRNTSVGQNSLFYNISDASVAIGYDSLKYNTFGINNTAIGYQSLLSNTAVVTTINITYGGSGYTINTTFSNIQLSHISGSTALIYPIVTVYVDLTGSVNTVTLVTGGVGFIDNTTVMGANLGTGVTFSVIVNTTDNGSFNTAIGYRSLYTNITGDQNTAIGYQSMVNNTTGYQNTAIGGASLQSNISGSSNTAIGNVALYSNTTGFSNVAIGLQSLQQNTIGAQNTAIGDASLQNNLSGNFNTAIGYQSLSSNISGQYNTAIGFQSLNKNTNSYNTAIGYQALQDNTTANANVAIGYQSLQKNTIGVSNLSIGFQSLWLNKTGSRNISMGDATMASNISGGYNVSIGNGVLNQATASVYNTVIGSSALQNLLVGDNNTAIGNKAGYSSTTSNGLGGVLSLTQSSNSVFIGADIRPIENQTNQIIIGYGATGSGSNSVTLGASSITKTQLRGLINLGNVPQYGSNGAAISAGLVPGDIYQTPGNALMVVV